MNTIIDLGFYFVLVVVSTITVAIIHWLCSLRESRNADAYITSLIWFSPVLLYGIATALDAINHQATPIFRHFVQWLSTLLISVGLYYFFFVRNR